MPGQAHLAGKPLDDAYLVLEWLESPQGIGQGVILQGCPEGGSSPSLHVEQSIRRDRSWCQATRLHQEYKPLWKRLLGRGCLR